MQPSRKEKMRPATKEDVAQPGGYSHSPDSLPNRAYRRAAMRVNSTREFRMAIRKVTRQLQRENFGAGGDGLG